MTHRLRTLVAGAALLALTACGSTLQEGATTSTIVLSGPEGTVAEGPTATEVTTPAGGPGAAGGAGAGGAGGGAGGPVSGGGPSGAGGAGGAVTDPISLGFLVEGGSAPALGLTPATSLKTSDVYKALVAAYNAHGGMAGRRIEPVYAGVSGNSNDYNAEGQSACEKLTRDNDVEAVLAGLGTYSATFEACLAQTSTPHVEGGFVTGGDRELAAYPLLLAPAALSVDRRIRAMVDVSVADGWLTPANRVGVLLDDCPHNRRAYEGSLAAALQAHGMSVTKLNALRCTTGISSAGDAAAAMQNFVLSFKQAGVDRVLTISDFESVAVLLFMQSADSQRYQPGYLLSSVSGIAALIANVPPGQLPGVHGAGWLPPADISAPTLGAGFDRCLALLAEQGVRLGTSGDMYLASSACEVMFLYEIGLQATRGDSTPATIVAAMTAAAGSYGHPALTAPSGLSASRHDGVGSAQAFAWDGSCSCLRYRGAPHALR